jgi:hypothetical protein
MSEQDVTGGSAEPTPAFKAVQANVALYECEQCAALVTKGGQKKHQKSHADHVQALSMISGIDRTRY